MMKTVALVDTNHGRGHHLTYMRVFSKSLLEMGHRVLVFYPKPNEVTNWINTQCPGQAEHFFSFEMSEFKHQQIPLFGKLLYHSPVLERFPQPLSVLGRWWQAASMIQEAAEITGFSPDLVFFNWLDNYLSYYLTHHLIDWIFPYPWSGLYFRPGELRFRKQSLLPHYAIAQSPQCKALAILNEELVEEFQQRLKTPIIAFPDFTDNSIPDTNYDLVQQIQAKAGSRKIIGLMGSLSKRKGILTLLEVAERSTQENWFFVFVGFLSRSMFHQDYEQRFDEEYLRVKQISESPPPNCFFHLEHIPTEAGFNALISTCNFLFAAYENFPYSSNILAKSAFFKKPIIVSEGYCMGDRVKKFRLGLSIPEGDVIKCIEALHTLCESSNSSHSLKFDFESYTLVHSVDQVGRVFECILEKCNAEPTCLGSLNKTC
jgi:glycosyltransferase involved in cell wall biosynthesis